MKKALLIAGVAASLLAGTAALAQTGSPSLSLSGGSTPYSTVTVAGNGFQPGEMVHLILGLSSTTVAADGSGSFSGATLQIPDLSPGLYLVLAVGQTSGLTAYSNLYISALYAQAFPSSWWIAPGSQLTWSGSGFVPDEQITISRGGTTVATFKADSNGSFSGAGSSMVPFSAKNSTLTYTLDSSLSHTHASYNVGVSDLYPYANPSTWYTTPGTTVTFTGSGFGAGEGVSVFLGDSTTALAHISTDQSGSFTSAGSVTIPYKSASPAAFRLVGDLSGASALAPVTLAPFYPTLTPSAYYSAPGSTITVGGSGFAPNETVYLSVDGASTTQATTDGSGAFTPVTIHIPPKPNTMITVSAVGETSGASTNFTMAVGAYYSWMTLSTYWAQGGTPLIVYGHNFAGGETVTLSSDSKTLATTTADDTGSFTAHLFVPFQPSGPASIFATGQESGATAQGTMTVAPVYTDLQLKQYYGAPGDHIEFIGHGYLPNETITVTTDRTGSASVATFSADATGSFYDSSFVIPADFTPGNLTLTVTGAHSFDQKSITIYVTGA